MAAHALSLLEYALETHFAPVCKAILRTYGAPWGLLGMILGDSLRKAALITAGVSFHHMIQRRRSPRHVLVTQGVYAYARHPSYLGFLLFSIGTQCWLGNPVCLVAFYAVLLRFFQERVTYEEHLLRSPAFFGEAYVEYCRKVPVWIPGLVSVVEASHQGRRLLPHGPRGRMIANTRE